MISLKQVGLTYSKQGKPIPALTGVDLEFAPGEFIVVLGANGSGKTTLAKLICGALNPTQGEVLINVNGRNPAAAPDFSPRIALLGSTPQNQLIAQTVEEEIAFGLENLGWESQAIRRRVDCVLQTFGLENYARRQSRLLSAGEQQKVALSSLMALQPDYLMLDEPLSYLDDAEAEQMGQTIINIQRQNGLGLLWITQDLVWAAQAQRLLVLSEGRIALSGSPQEVLSQSERLESLGIEIPELMRLGLDLQSMGYAIDTPILQLSDILRFFLQ